jgi:hypothetical protein
LVVLLVAANQFGCVFNACREQVRMFWSVMTMNPGNACRKLTCQLKIQFRQS